jgi:L-histidine N-alpha-methyltransferase
VSGLGEGDVEVRLDPGALDARLRADVLAGLSDRPRQIASTWFYDEEGSRLFDEITRLEEYYQTRTERTLLGTHAAQIVEASAARSLLELGSGTCEKTRVLLDELARQGRLERIVPIDISSEFLERSVVELAAEYPDARVTGLVDDFDGALAALPAAPSRLVAFLGGTIGNLRPSERSSFFERLVEQLDASDSFLLGVDLIKAEERLVAAYDDAKGVTAEFNRNVLAVLNRSLGGDFDLDAFDHVARWDAEESWIEMRLRSRHAQRVELRSLELVVDFDQGEDLLTEISAKFTVASISAELEAAGLVVLEAFTDADSDFALLLARPRRGTSDGR